MKLFYISQLTKILTPFYIIFLLNICFYIATAFEVYKEGWWDGYYADGEVWRPCHTSWKTCSNVYPWNTWEDHMFMNTTTGLWERWPYGEYFDLTSQTWRSWSGSWNEAWKYQITCFICFPGQVFGNRLEFSN